MNRDLRNSWNEVRAWRRSTRGKLIAQRRTLSQRERRRCNNLVAGLLSKQEREFLGQRVAFYWPLQGEINLVPFMRRILPSIKEAGLPVIARKQAPLEFWRWSARTELVSRGLSNIPSPVDRFLIEPDLLLIPLVGFDEAGYRLGYGGGYYDRTLAALTSRPVTVGIGYEMARLETIHPQPHDIPLDAIVTEHSIRGALKLRG